MFKLFLFDEYIGNLFVEQKNGKETFSFEFSSDYLSKHDKLVIDPALRLYAGRQYSEGVFGFVSDLIPDRFGKALLKEKERQRSLKENRIPKKLTTLDYILGVNDLTRMGAIRIQNEEDRFVSDDKENVVPPYIYLRDIEQASLKFENSGAFESDEYRRLLLPGSSLGGARPKANIYYSDELWIAKFPSRNDTYDVEAWEKIIYDLAGLCAINVSESKIESYSKLGSTLLIKRFDRDKNKRIHYISFMTALNANDGDSGDYSYLDLVSYIRSSCDDIDKNLTELYKRNVFAYLVNDTDNHLRNHGLLFDGCKLMLAPMFDVNPSFESDRFGLSLTSGTINKNAIINESKYYNIKKEDAIIIYDNMVKTIGENFIKTANKYKVRTREIELFTKIFESRK